MVVGQKTPIKTPVKMTFKSSNPKVAAVNSTGKVTAKAKGNATITAKISDVTWTYKIKVEKPKLSNIKLSVYTKTSKQLKLKGTSRKITWSSSAPSVVSVNKNGRRSGYVWIPSTGSKYHSHASCSGMRSPRQVSISQAISMGYSACNKCY